MPNPVQFAQIVVADVANGATMPAGTIIDHGCAPGSPPSGWLLCNGSAISRTTYAALFTAISTRFGAGDSSTTFNIPNLIAKFRRGNATSGTDPGGTGGAATTAHAHDVTVNAGNITTGTGSQRTLDSQTLSTLPPYLELTPLIKT